MIKAFCMMTHREEGNTDLADKIRDINPDKIILWHQEEIDFEYIFGSMLDELQPWLASNHKFIDVITPHAAAGHGKNRPHIQFEQGLGYLLSFMTQLRFPEYTSAYDSNTALPPHNMLPVADKLYTCYCHNEKPERLRLVDELVGAGLLDAGIVTYHKPNFHGGWRYHDGSRLVDEPEFVLSSGPGMSPMDYARSYFRGAVDVVAESRYAHGEFFMTEKTMKSIMAFKPFLPLSCQHFCTHYLVGHYGLELYTELFDYNYDQEPSVDSRIAGIIHNIKRLQAIDRNQLHRMIAKMMPKMMRNRNRLLELYTDVDKMVPTCMRWLLDSKEYALFGTDLVIFHYLRERGLMI